MCPPQLPDSNFPLPVESRNKADYCHLCRRFLNYWYNLATYPLFSHILWDSARAESPIFAQTSAVRCRPTAWSFRWLHGKNFGSILHEMYIINAYRFISVVVSNPLRILWSGKIYAEKCQIVLLSLRYIYPPEFNLNMERYRIQWYQLINGKILIQNPYFLKNEINYSLFSIP